MADLDKVAKSAQPESVYNGLPLWVFLSEAAEFRVFLQPGMGSRKKRRKMPENLEFAIQTR